MNSEMTIEGWQLEPDSAEAYERYLASAFSGWARELVALANVKEGERVLDVACGTGIVARQAAAKAGASGRVVGVDLNEGMLAVARRVAPHLEWQLGDASSLTFPDASFDAVFCEQALQFFSDPARAVAEMRRVLSPGGRVAVSVCRPLRYSVAYTALAGALDRHAGAEAGAIMRSPFSTWNVDGLRALFVDAGFIDVQVRIEAASLRYPSFEELLRREAASSPLAGAVGQMSTAARERLVRELETALADHVDDAGVVCPLETYVAVAHRAC